MADEMRGFVFAVIFIIIFSALLVSIPAGLEGTEDTPDLPVPVDPNIISGFAAYENYTFAAFTGSVYEYDLEGYSWRCVESETSLILAAKVYLFGFLWFGALDYCSFESSSNRGTSLSQTEIAADAENGTVTYAITLESGNTAGSFVVYWNSTLYPDIADAWDNDAITFIHGMGFDSAATANIAALLISLLFFQLPNVPVLVNVFLAAPLWACIVFVLWFVIKEMIPFS